MSRAYLNQIDDFPVSVKYAIFQHLLKDEALKAYRALCRDVEHAERDRHERELKRRAAQGEHLQLARERKRRKDRRSRVMSMSEFMEAEL